MKLVKKPNATIEAMIQRLKQANIDASAINQAQGQFELGIILSTGTANPPLMVFGARANPSEIAEVVVALHGVGSWGISERQIFLDRTENGIEVFTLEQAMAKYGIEFIFGQPDHQSKAAAGGSS